MLKSRPWLRALAATICFLLAPILFIGCGPARLLLLMIAVLSHLAALMLVLNSALTWRRSDTWEVLAMAYGLAMAGTLCLGLRGRIRRTRTF
ncbi:hypothetical protein [Roseomonas sp. KE0001]|uniref:hypothetical protein n=1 Tax=Roseomonas sp. KE0001 TaxID=2479201 RepID=UPI0018E01DE4|nr:hypothetical protein [Roseomonas sp. KE0001]MBI0435864.1 hypothetical protein [Roseomonas sp. KE0001]